MAGSGGREEGNANANTVTCLAPTVRGRGGGGNARGFLRSTNTEDIDTGDGMRDEVRVDERDCPSSANFTATS
jgi:hypothetical protein